MIFFFFFHVGFFVSLVLILRASADNELWKAAALLHLQLECLFLLTSS